MTVFACWPSMTRPTTVMCVRQCSSARVGLAGLDQRGQPLLRPDAPPPGGGGLAVGIGLAHGGDGPGDDLVEHLGHDREGLVAGHAPTSSSWKRALAWPNASGSSMTCSCSAMSSRSRRADRAATPAEATRRTAAGSMIVRASKTSASDTLRACSTSAAVRAVCRWSGRCTTTPPSTPRTTVIRPSASRMRRASRSDGPRHPEALDEVGLVAERVALVELAGDDEAPQLVGDLLGLLAPPVARRRVGGLAFDVSAIGASPHRRSVLLAGRCAAHAR